MHNELAELDAFLRSAFNGDQLRRWVYYAAGKAVYDALPDRADIETLAFRTVQLLESAGRLDAVLFRSLVSAREDRADDIRALARRFDVNLDDPVPATAAQGAARGASATRPRRGERQPTPTPVSSGSRRRGQPSRLAVLLDRTGQWGRLLHLCDTSDEPVALVAHGPAAQDVELFCRRVQVQLHDDCKRTHEVYRLRFVDHYARAALPEEWEERLRLAVGLGGFDAAEAVRRRARDQPLLLIVGEAPLRDLNAEETWALTEFLGTTLPGIVARAAPQNPIRVLVPIEHARPDAGLADPLVQAVLGALERARNHGFTTDILIELGFPDWTEVEAFLYQELGRLDIELLKQCRAVYDEIARKPTAERRLSGLAVALDRIVRAHLNPETPDPATESNPP